TFDAKYAGEVPMALTGLRSDASTVDDVRQRLWAQFFTAKKGEKPRIASYAGRGDLRRWVRAAATRAAIDVLRITKREVLRADEAELETILRLVASRLELTAGAFRP